jgi:hypothetical protein
MQGHSGIFQGFMQQTKNVVGGHAMAFVVQYLLNKIQNILVVHKLYIAPIDFLLCVLLLLHLEYMLWRKMPIYLNNLSMMMFKLYLECHSYLIKMLLQLLICEVDT